MSYEGSGKQKDRETWRDIEREKEREKDWDYDGRERRR